MAFEHKIRLTQGKFAVVDRLDLDWLSRHKWYAKRNTSKNSPNGKYYAARCNWINGRCETVYMHREIMNCPDDMEVDHKNDNSLCNKHVNLIICTRKEHMNKVYT